MDFPNAFHGGMGLNLRGPFPNARMNSATPFDLQGVHGGFAPGLDEHLRRLALIREAEIRARLELRDGLQPLPPGLDNGMFMDRDRMRDRDIELRDTRDREERDHGRDRERWRNDYDRNKGRSSDYDQNRDSNRSDRHRDRDRSPIHSGHSGGGADSDTRTSKYSSNDNDLYPDDESSMFERFRNRSSDIQIDLSRSSIDERGGDKWVSNQPSRTIILRGLHLNIDEKIISSELMLLRLPVKDIRLIRRSTGVSRGFAFVEFHNVADAQRWMEHAQVHKTDKYYRRERLH